MRKFLSGVLILGALANILALFLIAYGYVHPENEPAAVTLHLLGCFLIAPAIGLS
jgi:hypothetical protein